MLANLSKTEHEILEEIKFVIDPEVEINVVDLGLIYTIKHNEADKEIDIEATLSARGCPVGDTILMQIETVVQEAFPGYTVNVELVWEPCWTPEMITPAGKAALNR
jgi:metal-sulfur cluster biosynthetic enzyme